MSIFILRNSHFPLYQLTHVSKIYRIRWAAGRTTPIKSTTTPHDSAATVYVRFLTLEDNMEITEESLRTLFNQYGPVFDCAIKKLAQEQVIDFFCLFVFMLTFLIGVS